MTRIIELQDLNMWVSSVALIFARFFVEISNLMNLFVIKTSNFPTTIRFCKCRVIILVNIFLKTVCKRAHKIHFSSLFSPTVADEVVPAQSVQ